VADPGFANGRTRSSVIGVRIETRRRVGCGEDVSPSHWMRGMRRGHCLSLEKIDFGSKNDSF